MSKIIIENKIKDGKRKTNISVENATYRDLIDASLVSIATCVQEADQDYKDINVVLPFMAMLTTEYTKKFLDVESVLDDIYKDIM